jgi:regulatory protein
LARSLAHLDALKMLARRDLSEAQVRQRLARKGHSPHLIDEAVSRLRNEGAIDDERVAEALARAEAERKGRGRLRIVQALARSGIGRNLAERAAARALAHLDPAEHAAAALEKRLRGRAIEDESEFRRLYRYLIGQGFEADRALAALKARRKP